MYNEELHNLYLLTHIRPTKVRKSRRIRWAGHAVCMGETRNAYIVVVGTAEEKIWEDVDCIHVAENRVRRGNAVNTAMNTRVP
jgi:hypothetical protein